MDGQFALPVLPSIQNSEFVSGPESQTQFKLGSLFLPKSKIERMATPSKALKKKIEQFLSDSNVSNAEQARLLTDLPSSWQRHGDMVVIREGFRDPLWNTLRQDLWYSVAAALGCSRIALSNRVAPDGFRSPVVRLVLGGTGWVQHCDNGIKYVFDVTKSMFSAGNITEKLRMASMDCHGETVVDLFAGIGYFTLPLLVHGKASVVHACDWNPVAVEGLRKGLEVNGVAKRCVVHCGDNVQVSLAVGRNKS